MKTLIVIVIVVIMLILIGAAMSARIVKQYEQRVLFRLGRVQGPRNPDSAAGPALSRGGSKTAPVAASGAA